MTAPDDAGAAAPTRYPGDPGGQAETAEALLVRVAKLERQLAAAQRNGVRAAEQLHAALLADVRAAERRARKAEKQAAAAESRASAAQRRAKQAQAELAGLRSSTTWKAGRVLVAVPGRVKRWGRS